MRRWGAGHVLEVWGCAGAGVHFEAPDPTTIDFTLQLNSTVKFFRGKTQNPVRSSSAAAAQPPRCCCGCHCCHFSLFEASPLCLIGVPFSFWDCVLCVLCHREAWGCFLALRYSDVWFRLGGYTHCLTLCAVQVDHIGMPLQVAAHRETTRCEGNLHSNMPCTALLYAHDD